MKHEFDYISNQAVMDELRAARNAGFPVFLVEDKSRSNIADTEVGELCLTSKVLVPDELSMAGTARWVRYSDLPLSDCYGLVAVCNVLFVRVGLPS